MKPLNLKTHEVQAVLSGVKTQHRIIIKPQPHKVYGYMFWRGKNVGNATFVNKSPYQPDDILYVKETWVWVEDTSYDEYVSIGGWKYKADGHHKEDKWKSSIHMPKEAARIFLKVKSVRIEQLQDISEEGAIDEGCKQFLNVYRDLHISHKGYFEWKYLQRNGRDAWNLNPWVWVIEFERVFNEK